MREFMGPPARYYEQPSGHESHCNCSPCHQQHIEHQLVSDYANDADHECCKRELDSWIEQGRWCEIHGDAYIDKKNYCLECGYEMAHHLAANF